MCQNNTANIQQMLSTKEGLSLSVRSLHWMNTFEMIQSQTQEVLPIDPTDQAAEYILTFIASCDLSKTPDSSGVFLFRLNSKKQGKSMDNNANSPGNASTSCHKRKETDGYEL